MPRHPTKQLFVIAICCVFPASSESAVEPLSPEVIHHNKRAKQPSREEVSPNLNPLATQRGTSVSNPSLCVTVVDGCHVVGGLIEIAVILGPGDPIITFGQFSLQYNPDSLTFVGISPGATCDQLSPFSTALGQTHDTVGGTVAYAVGVDVFSGEQGTQGPATMACLSFIVRDNAPNSVCLFDAGNPFSTQLSDDAGRVPIDNSLNCPPGQPLPTISCAEIELSPTCICETGIPDCSSLNSDCSVGSCSDVSGECESLPINEGVTCDDRITCTIEDTCQDGACRGTGCPNPSLCVVAEDDGQTSDPTIEVRVVLGQGQGNDLINAGQFNLEYDPTVLEFVSASAGSTCDPSSPFIASGFLQVDEFNGTVFLVVSVDPFIAGANLGTLGPATMACLTFLILSPSQNQVCLVPGVNPRFTLLSNQRGRSVVPDNAEDCPVDPPSSALSCVEPPIPIPSASEWGLIILALLLLSASKVCFRSHSLAAADRIRLTRPLRLFLSATPREEKGVSGAHPVRLTLR